MKHIGKTNENEVIVTLTYEDLENLMTATNAAAIYYDKELKIDPDNRGAMVLRKQSNNWWVKLYELQKTIK